MKQLILTIHLLLFLLLIYSCLQCAQKQEKEYICLRFVCHSVASLLVELRYLAAPLNTKYVHVITRARPK